jgi:hypothetical protein
LPKISLLFSLTSQVNAAIDAGRVKVKPEEMRYIIDQGELFSFLKGQREDFEVNISPEDQDYLNRNLAQMASLFRSAERKKLGIEKNGLCLLLAYLLELIQRSSEGSNAWDAKDH